MVRTVARGRISEPVVRTLGPSSRLVDVFPSFLDLPYPVLLDSTSSSGREARFAYLTADPFMVVRSKGKHVETEFQGSIERRESSPFDVLQELLRVYRFSRAPGAPPFQGGAVGYLAYELAHHLERLPLTATDDLDLPEMNVGLYDWVIAQDRQTRETWAISTGLPEASSTRAEERLQQAVHRMDNRPDPSDPTADIASPSQMRSTFSREEYLEAVSAVKKYIVQGDTYQVNISQRFEVPLKVPPWQLYRRLRKVNPAPFAAYLQYPEVAVLSASPEEYLRLEGGSVETRPMKGTRPRGRDPGEDRRLAAELYASDKERAENVMIVDLMRNDLGRVCIPGSIHVPDLFTVERHPVVFQMVSTVRGEIRADVDAVDVLKACFPGGSVTGAPKIRAMEIIDELEPTQRSVYCGAIGYIGFGGSMVISIPIRILLAKGDMAYFQVGGGVVADSDPEAEYRETLDKAEGSLRALGIHN
ncbi:MAG: aminodeoxychorismate synthase component I [SAR202 cluster bacterium]|nr:aminodeoxychorismate synthase component I [SAR202 cluster bacterium]